MVHVRLNERETNPNPHINFITALPADDLATQEGARQLLRALAAQVRPVMKANGFAVNSFEEYEHNKVFAGRNWNNGETVELVLRGVSGAFLPISWLMSTLCHELAHIKHMNHGPAFQTLWAKLRSDVRALQSKGYYGDGYWSSGTRLADSARVGSQSLDADDLPEYMCGGAQTRARPTSMRRRRARQSTGPSNHTGAQTAKKRKAGSRVTAQGTFKGSGHALNEDISDEEQKKVGTGFRKKAGSKRAREERALAIERRLQALQGKANALGPQDDSEDADEFEGVSETDQDRRRVMLEGTTAADLEGLKVSGTDYSSDFIFPHAGPSSSSAAVGVIEISSDEECPRPDSCDVQLLPRAGPSTAVVPMRASDSDRVSKGSGKQTGLSDWLRSNGASPKSTGKRKLPYGAMVQDEMRSRKQESLGMAGDGRRLGGEARPLAMPPRNNPSPFGHVRELISGTGDGGWTCLVCTLSNEPEHLACSACSTPRGESSWLGNEA
ncbi:DNA-dependent metalloprotease WSS1 [Grifola frondosa]|uniref:DNA-dependent metalloprotease WSS1 n=1 Tax=Grifola frondosa TaxID=5627 RepID=A0A1C7M7S1_GRIFR|nr:DNA-dependent metalloprotease WSS1 [Grifola frondosa]